ncbi:MAG: hypothetical protein C0392_09760 [Syntrophus sp. (in: bacteria)]|nr:hypothetical protein [Syntrophus sp. (in: bacteria)]
MPLAFQSLSHGEIAFGFFNIESDMILLNQYFLFAQDFCRDISKLASAWPDEGMETEWDVYVLRKRDIGNLMGAIHGIDYSGFIGETYRLFPFPKGQEAFKQNPEGYKTREIIENIVEKYTTGLSSISVKVNAKPSGITIAIGEYHFTTYWFHELLRYIWMGGFPRWKSGIHPQYVIDMEEAVKKSSSPLFGLKFSLTNQH